MYLPQSYAWLVDKNHHIVTSIILQLGKFKTSKSESSKVLQRKWANTDGFKDRRSQGYLGGIYGAATCQL